MKKYIATVTIEVYADTDAAAIRTAQRTAEIISRNHHPNTEIESIQEHRFHGLCNRYLNISRITDAQTLPTFISNLFKMIAR